MSKPIVRRPMTPEELEAVKCLSSVKYPAASWDKRFARHIQGETISEKEAPQVWRLFHKYRRQISTPNKARLLKLSEQLAAPDFRKQQGHTDELRRYQEAMATANVEQRELL